jgi:hypothetical protein
MFQTNFGYLGYIILLLVITGWMLIRLDTNGYKIENMPRESKLARILGWINISIAGCAFILVYIIF